MDKKDKLEVGNDNPFDQKTETIWTDDPALIKPEMVQFFFMG